MNKDKGGLIFIIAFKNLEVFFFIVADKPKLEDKKACRSEIWKNVFYKYSAS